MDKNGAVLYNAKTKQLAKDLRVIQEACPWSIPQLDQKSGLLTKCDMCVDRVAAGLQPACVKACPTGALNFGNEAAIKGLAKERLAKAKKSFAGARILDAADVQVLYLVIDDYAKYLQSA